VPRFEVELERHGSGVVAWIPGEVMESLGGKRVPVTATVNGYTWRTTTFVYGGRAVIGLRKEVRAGAGVDAGDTVTVELERDEAPREVEVPEVLAEALAHDPDASEAFDSLSYTHRKEYAVWIAEAKRPETRERRVTETLQRLRTTKK
jgi:Bacteriocin-protection, YdeI or OmpD-Associated/Domain of unknown function (DUF1905)